MKKEIKKPTKYLKTKETVRSFGLIDFKDAYSQECSIQESSLVDPHIWIGVDNVGPLLDGPSGKRNEQVSVRMHINQKQAAAIAKILIHFSKTSYLPKRYVALN